MAGVGDREHDVVARRRPGVARRVRLVELGVPRLDRQLPAARHRVAGIDREVDDDLAELAGVDRDPADVGLDPDGHLDRLAEEGPQERHDLLDDRGRIDDLRLEHLLAAEGEELADEGGRPVGGSEDVVEILDRGMVGHQRRPGQVGVAPNGGQQVVEVMRNSARPATRSPRAAAIAGAAPRGSAGR